MMCMNNTNATPVIDIIVLTKDNFDELIFTLNSISQLSLTKSFTHKISIYDSSILPLNSGSDPINHVLGLSKDIAINYKYIYPAPGIYPSMNIALNLSQSDLLIFLNSGDRFKYKNSLEELVRTHMKSAMINSHYVATFGKTFFKAYANDLCWVNPLVPPRLISRWLNFYYPCHQSTIFNTEWAKNNPYPLNKGINADESILRKAFTYKHYSYCPYIISEFSLNGISSKPLSFFELFSQNSDGISIKRIIKSIVSPSFIPNMLPLYSFVKSSVVNKFLAMVDF